MRKEHSHFTAFLISGIILLSTSFLIFSQGYAIQENTNVGIFMSLILHVMIFVKPLGTLSLFLSFLLLKLSFNEYRKEIETKRF